MDYYFVFPTPLPPSRRDKKEQEVRIKERKNKMRKLNLTIIILTLLLSYVKAFSQEDLSPKKMIKVTSEMLDIFVNGKSDELRKYISNEWLDEKNLNVKKYKINNYAPERYYVAFAVSNVCVAMIYGSSWAHLLIFKFTDEMGTYRVIPRVRSVVNKDYIDPWWGVETYICESFRDRDK
jgi:hypothetical protein